MLRSWLYYISIFSAIITIRCGALFLVDKNCFDISNELRLFPGIVGETIVFYSSKGGNRLFKIIKKYADHITGYTTDTGCSCNDFWEVELKDSSLTLSFSTSLQYLADEEGTREEEIQIIQLSNSYVFREYNKTIHDSILIEGQSLKTVLEYRRVTTSPDQIEAVFFAKDIGLVKFVMGDGETFTNVNLKVLDNSGTSSWDYYEQKCE
jgi:hypothetical protein